MRAGLNRHRIVIERFSDAVQPTGDVTRSWVAQATKWGKIRSLSSRERIEAQTTEGQVTHEISWRFDPGFTATTADRITHEGRVFEILGIFQRNEDRRMVVAQALESGA